MNQYLIKYVRYDEPTDSHRFGEQTFFGKTPQQVVDKFRRFNKNQNMKVLQVCLIQGKETWK